MNRMRDPRILNLPYEFFVCDSDETDGVKELYFSPGAVIFCWQLEVYGLYPMGPDDNRDECGNIYSLFHRNPRMLKKWELKQERVQECRMVAIVAVRDDHVRVFDAELRNTLDEFDIEPGARLPGEVRNRAIAHLLRYAIEDLKMDVVEYNYQPSVVKHSKREINSLIKHK